MFRGFIRFISGSVFAGACTFLLLHPVAHAQSANTAKPVAFVYVSSSPSDGDKNVINAFTAAADGRLTEVSGAPYALNDAGLSIDSGHLYGANNSKHTIDTYSIAASGALHDIASTDYRDVSKGCGQAGSLFPDRTGSDVYVTLFDGDCANDSYESFAADNSKGSLKDLGDAETGAFFAAYLPAAFLSNNRYAYEASNSGCMYYKLWGLKRDSNGKLTAADTTATYPEPPDGSTVYVGDFTATDDSNHVAIALQAARPPGCSDSKPRLAAFTADSKGNLTTTNTDATMPSSINTEISDMKISPAGKLLAVGGEQGLEIFHFNGAKPPTPYTGIVTVDPVTQMFWDDANHLYVICRSAGRLHVFTITPESYHEASGSPYAIASPDYLAVDVR